MTMYQIAESPSQRERRLGCLRKQPFRNRGDAAFAARNLAARYDASGRALEAYRCKWGKHWHVGGIR